jgi:hypothetical protein
MSTSPNTPFQLLLQQTVLHDRVERLGLALGAAQERTLRAGLMLVPGETSPNTAIDRWENEGGNPSDVSTSCSFTTPRSTKITRFSADLFRDDALARAVIMNASLILIAATILILMYD